MGDKYKTIDVGYFKKYNKSIIRKPLSIEEVKTLTITVAEGDKLETSEGLLEFIAENQGAMILKKRLAIKNIDITNRALLACSLFIDRAGVAVIVAIDILNSPDISNPVSIYDIMEKVYPFGFYADDEDQLSKIVDLLKDRVIENSDLY